MNSKDKEKRDLKKEAFQPINSNVRPSAALARERFKRALSLNPAESPEEESLRESLTEYEKH
ncbi:MAG TPA: hypothetical protein GX691_03675 [Clostridia bacterium]|nr:hypothetical protein [Clostridia bacterium]